MKSERGKEEREGREGGREREERETHLRTRSACSCSFSSSSISVTSSQIVIIESAPPDTTNDSSRLMARAHTFSSWLSSVSTHSSSLTFHTLTRPSLAAVASCMPRVIKSTRKTEFEWPSNVLTHVKSLRFHSLTVRSPDAVARHWSTGLNLTLHTPRLWPLNVPRSESVAWAGADLVAGECAIANSLAVRSCEPDARSLSLGEMSSELMSLSWILVVDRARSGVGSASASSSSDRTAARSQILAVRSCDAVTRRCRSRLVVATAPTDSTWPSARPTHAHLALPSSPWRARHTRAVLSFEPETRTCPSVVRVRHRTTSSWPSRSDVLNRSRSYTRIRSELVATARCDSGRDVDASSGASSADEEDADETKQASMTSSLKPMIWRVVEREGSERVTMFWST